MCNCGYCEYCTGVPEGSSPMEYKLSQHPAGLTAKYATENVPGFPWYILNIKVWKDFKQLLTYVQATTANDQVITIALPDEHLSSLANYGLANKFILDHINHHIESAPEKFADLGIFDALVCVGSKEGPIKGALQDQYKYYKSSAPSPEDMLADIKVQVGETKKAFLGIMDHAEVAYQKVSEFKDSLLYDDFGVKVSKTMSKAFPALAVAVRCPVDNCVRHKDTKGSIRNVIICLNDTHRWTRDQIADWLESLDVDLQIKEKNGSDS